MPDPRPILAAIEIAVAVLVERRNCGHLFGWMTYCYFSGAVNLAPFLAHCLAAYALMECNALRRRLRRRCRAVHHQNRGQTAVLG